jgi:hypothetical protein
MHVSRTKRSRKGCAIAVAMLITPSKALRVNSKVKLRHRIDASPLARL